LSESFHEPLRNNFIFDGQAAANFQAIPCRFNRPIPVFRAGSRKNIQAISRRKTATCSDTAGQIMKMKIIHLASTLLVIGMTAQQATAPADAVTSRSVKRSSSAAA
jgi:hypothetical protein